MRATLFSHEHPAYPFHITANVLLTTFLIIFSSVTTMICNSSIQGELALSNREAIWITTLYLLGVNTTVPTANWFANQFGFNRMYTYGVVIFTLASLAAGLSSDFLSIASARFIEGIGAGFISPIGLALITKSVPSQKIALAVTLYVGIAFGAGIGLGILSAGYLAQFSSWRYAFLLIVPAGCLATISCWLSRGKTPDIHKTKFDYCGFFCFALFVASLLIALTLGPVRSTPAGWHTPYILMLFAIAALSLLLFLRFESRSQNPLFPFALFKDPIFTVSLATMFLLGMATFASVSVTVTYMLDGLGYEKFVTGKIAAIYGFTLGIFSIIANYLTKFFPIPLLTFTGLSILIFSFFYNNELSAFTGYKQVITILLLRGIGIGLSLGPTTLMALHSITTTMKPHAATILTFFRQVGGTYGGTLISIFSIQRTIFHTARFSEQVHESLPAYQHTVENLNPVQAKAMIVKNIVTQAQIQGLNDALIIFGYVTAVVSVILASLISYRMWKTRAQTPETENTT